MRPELWNTPNKLSVIRIAVSPLLVLLLLDPGEGLSVFCAVLFVLGMYDRLARRLSGEEE